MFYLIYHFWHHVSSVVVVLWCSEQPFSQPLSTVCDARKVRASGRGLQPSGVRVKDAADFRVYTEGAGEGNVEVKVIGPGEEWGEDGSGEGRGLERCGLRTEGEG